MDPLQTLGLDLQNICLRCKLFTVHTLKIDIESVENAPQELLRRVYVLESEVARLKRRAPSAWAIMTDYTNIDLFRIYSGTTFALLYEAFPLGKKRAGRVSQLESALQLP
ncbi:hypothetical protein MnTg02_02501 [bacterium MnTg02]|nr:hypothetical protein MnTg02_02501 [bacterium MnTg02]